MKRIAILGSTGSIGRSTLSVVETYPDRFQVVSLAAGRNLEAAFDQAQRWKPRVLSVADETDADGLKKRLKTAGLFGIEVVFGSAGTVQVATHPEADFVVSAIVGVAGLEATYEAVKAGKTLGLANKECLVAAGELITAEARRQGKPLLPIDSEHNAVHQCLRGGRMEEVQRIWLTASGGPFRNTPKSQFSSITVEQALNHPTWKMGQRITIDSATLMNKGFEVIEAENGQSGPIRLIHGPLPRPIHGVLLDMPLTGGLATLHHLRQQHPGIPIIVMSSVSNIQIAREAVNQGAPCWRVTFTVTAMPR